MPDDAQVDPSETIAALRRELDARTAERDEALAQQAAISEIVQIINRSPGDLAPVFDSIVEKAHSLCGAPCGSLQLWDSEKFRGIAMRGFPEPMVESLRQGYSPGPNHPCRGLIGGARIAHCTDMAEIDDPVTQFGAKLSGIRTVVYVALRKDDVLLGQIVAGRLEVRPFTDRELALLQNFAAQAVIAIENARLITETREALEQQTATAEVLQVINSSPGDLSPVFDAILDKAHSLCGAALGSLGIYDGETWRAVAQRGYGRALADRLRQPARGSDNPLLQQLLDGARFVHVPDLAQLDHPIGRANVEEGIRTLMGVPLRKDDALLGTISIARREVRPFSDKEIALLENFAAQAVIAMENARLITETREALEQQTATAEVLQVINSSPGDLAPVFDAILEKAHSLCGADVGTLAAYDGEHFRALATHGYPERFMAAVRRPFRPNVSMQRLVDGERIVHLPDQRALESEPDGEATRAFLELTDLRTTLFVALRKDARVLGFISAHRHGVRPFSEKEIALLESFAAQAVIALENARLLGELRERTSDLEESLEYQTAISDVLKVISRSTFDLQPVLDTLVETAGRLCNAEMGMIANREGDDYRVAASFAFSPEWDAFMRTLSFRPGRDTVTGRTLLERQVVQINDITVDPEYALPGAATAGKMRTMIGVPLLREGEPIGIIALARQRVEPFTERQIELVRTFADQAVIAIENTRLITETREALEQRTATAEVLQVINSSPGDLAPVFEAMLERAMRLCEAAFGMLWTYDGTRYHAPAVHGAPPAFVEFVRQPQLPPYHPGSGLGRMLRGEDLVIHEDMAAEEAYRVGDPLRRAIVDLGGARTAATVSLRKEQTLLGAFTVYRQEVRPFSDKHIALLQNFAAQAVIAMENARLITETREALSQQTATAEVLGVINSSPGDLAPVFDALLDKGVRLCEAAFGLLMTYDGEVFRTVALHGVPPAYADFLREPIRPAPLNGLGRLLRGERLIHMADIADDEAYRSGDPLRVATVDLGGSRTHLVVPLIKDDALLGAIVAYRQEIRPFSDQQIALLQNFAAQAVIAMENARLITETREALEQQTATAEVLGVINSSPGDLTPVFEAMLEKATRLCEAPFGILRTWDGERFHFGAVHGDPRFCDWVRQRGPIRADRDASPLGRIVAGERVVHFADAPGDEGYRTVAGFRDMVEASGIHSAITVALHKDDALLGTITVYRQEVRPFSDKQIALLQNFAAQAVIAMENARLITETREALEQQTATAEVLGVINSSPGHLPPVFDAMLERAMRLCGAAYGELRTYDGERFRLAATHGVPSAYREYYTTHDTGIYGPGTGPARILAGERIVHVPDLVATEPYRRGDPDRHALVDLGGARAILLVPLLNGDAVCGYIMIYRREPGPFSNKQIALLQNFAAQAVIAMENARLITETREALEQQTATAEVLGVINSSPGDLAPVFDAMVERAVRLCEADEAAARTFDGEWLHLVAAYGEPGAFERLRQLGPSRPDGLYGPIAGGERVTHIADVRETEAFRTNPRARERLELRNIGSWLAVALQKDEALLGVINVHRHAVRPFSDKQIALLQNFAAQAVIAMENARLITETQEALEQQTATAEVLQVINSSPGDLAPVFDAMLEKATSLCEAAFGALAIFDGDTYRMVAMRNVPEPLVAVVQGSLPIRPETSFGRIARGESTVHIADVSTDETYRVGSPMRRALVDLAGARTALWVALSKDGAALGTFVAWRREVRPFSDKQIALLQNFAAQAVIAMENARLLGELQQRTGDLQESLEYQTATSDVLKVISRSTFDLQPVFETIVETAARLCQADTANIRNREGEAYRVAATIGNTPEYDAFLRGRLDKLSRGTVVGRAALEGQVVHVADIASDPEFKQAESVALGKNRTVLGVPLLREGVVVGTIGLGRKRVQPFTERQIELVRTFADQAVIALENARLLGELQARTDELTRSVAELQALEEVLRAVNSSLDLDTVLATIISRAAQLSQADEGTIYEFDETEEVFVPKSAFGMSHERVEGLRERRVRLGETHLGRAAVERAPVHVEDVQQDPTIPDIGGLLKGIHAVLAVPLLREDKVVGGLVIRRRTVGGFAPTIPTLLQTFAGQAVLAIENARLFQELAARGEEARRARTAAEAALADLRRAQDRLIQAEKMASLGQLTAGIAHEIKNPLNFVNNFAGLSVELLDELKEAARPAIAGLAEDERADVDEIVGMLTGNLEKIAEHGKRADGIVKSMLEHSRGGTGERREVDLNGLVEEALNLAYHGARAQDQNFNITLERKLAPRIAPIELVPQDVTRVLLNLFGNGFYAATKRQRDGAEPDFRPTLKVSTRDLGDAVEIRVRDNGTGIAPDIRDKLFQPFFTTKPTGEGTGLGLSISWDIVTQEHGGTIEVDSRGDEFTEFTIRLPRRAATGADLAQAEDVRQ